MATETISRLERGATIPSVPRLDDVARALGVGMGDLFEAEQAVLQRNAAPAALVTELKRRPVRDIELIRSIARTVLEYTSSGPSPRRPLGGK